MACSWSPPITSCLDLISVAEIGSSAINNEGWNLPALIFAQTHNSLVYTFDDADIFSSRSYYDSWPVFTSINTTRAINSSGPTRFSGINRSPDSKLGVDTEEREQPYIVFSTQYRASKDHSHLPSVLAFEQVGQILWTFLQTLLDMEPSLELPFCQPFSKRPLSLSIPLFIVENDEALHFCGLGDQVRVALQATGIRIIW
jgi:hypothetical protein